MSESPGEPPGLEDESSPSDGETRKFGGEITVTTSRAEKEVFEEPLTVEVITREDIVSRKKVVNFVDSLEEISGVSIQKTAQGQGSPFIRGFTGYQNLMLIDGVRFNNSVLRSGPTQYWSTIDPFSAKRVELVKGAGSILYGSDAVGGTVNMITKGTPLVDGDVVGARGNLYVRWAGAENAFVGRAEAQGSHGDRFGYRVGATLFDVGDFRAGSDTGTVDYSGYDEYGVDAKFQYLSAADSVLTLVHQSFRQNDVPRTETTIFSKPFQGTLTGTELRRDHDQSRSISYLRFEKNLSRGLIKDYGFTLSYQETGEERTRVRGDMRSDISGFDVVTIGGQGYLHSHTRVGEITLGADYYHDDVDSFRTDFNADGSLRKIRVQGPVADDATYDILGIYLQDALTVADESLTLMLGGRFNYQKLSAGRVENPATGEEISVREDWSNLIGSLRLMWRPGSKETEGWRIFASVGQSFRAPNLSDLTALDSTSAVETPTPGLEPESYLNLEVGSRFQSQRLSIVGSLFRTNIDDQIVQSPTGRFIGETPEVQKSNVGDGFVQGIEMSGAWWVERRVEIWANGSWMEGEVDQFLLEPDGTALKVRASVSRLVPWMSNWGVRYWWLERDAWIEFHGSAFSKADQLALRDLTDRRRIPPGGTPAFAVVGIRAEFRFFEKRLALAIGLENLLDQDYRIHGSGQNMPGRNLVISGSWDW